METNLTRTTLCLMGEDNAAKAAFISEMKNYDYQYLSLRSKSDAVMTIHKNCIVDEPKTTEEIKNFRVLYGVLWIVILGSPTEVRQLSNELLKKESDKESDKETELSWGKDRLIHYNISFQDPGMLKEKIEDFVKFLIPDPEKAMA